MPDCLRGVGATEEKQMHGETKGNGRRGDGAARRGGCENELRKVPDGSSSNSSNDSGSGSGTTTVPVSERKPNEVLRERLAIIPVDALQAWLGAILAAE